MPISIFLPDSLLAEDRSLRDKTVKLGFIARSCAIFKVEKIYIYTDEGGIYENDSKLIKYILEYIETPQYLRKRLFPLSANLKEVGVLPPLRTPHHKSWIPLNELKVGEIREGVIFRSGGSLWADLGLDQPIKFIGSAYEGERVTCIIDKLEPYPACRRAKDCEIKEYWGYRVLRIGPIGKFLKSGFSGLKIIASRLGSPINKCFEEVKSAMKSVTNIALIFGSPRRGLYDILKDEHLRPEDVSDFVLNFVPEQGTATIRTEEAILIALSTVNIISLVS
ncbi:MAG: putative RNA uridine N3 methyltransferase [Nitrososphaeria archaeon]